MALQRMSWPLGCLFACSVLGLVLLTQHAFRSEEAPAEMLQGGGFSSGLQLKWDSPQAKSVVHWENKVDDLYGKLNKAEIHLAHLTHRVLHADAPGTSHLKARQQSLHAVRAGDALADAVQEAQQHVDSLSAALEDAKAKLNGKVDLVIDAQTLAHTEGTPGPRGPEGKKGEPGPQGQPGDQGPDGPGGVYGGMGPKGHNGEQGQRGRTGDVGIQGKQGYPGTTGPEGYPGPDGPRGDMGAPGPRGPPGRQGAVGYQGSPGAQGNAGVMGTPGAKGVVTTKRKTTKTAASPSPSSASASPAPAQKKSKARASELALLSGRKELLSIEEAKASVRRNVKAAEKDEKALKKEEQELQSVRVSGGAGGGAGEKESGPDAEHAEDRKAVGDAFARFYAHRLAQQKTAAAKAKKAATEGWDVTPWKHCKGTDCNVELYIETPTPKVDTTFLTGHHYHPSMEGLRNDIKERGELSLHLPEPHCVGVNGGCERISPVDDGKPFEMTYDLPGKSAAIGGYKNSGKLLPIGSPDPRVPSHVYHLAQQHDSAEEAEEGKGGQGGGWVEGLKSLVGGGMGGGGGKVLPAAAKLIKEEALLRRTAKRIEKVADTREREAQQQDAAVHAAVSVLLGQQQQQQQQPKPKVHQSMLARLQQTEAQLAKEQSGEEEEGGQAAAAEEGEKGRGAAVDAKRWLGQHGSLGESEGALENAASVVGNTLMSYLPLYLARQDVAESQPKAGAAGDEAFAPILSGQKPTDAQAEQRAEAEGRGQLARVGEGAAKEGRGRKGGVGLGRVRAEARRLEGSLEQSLSWLAPSAPEKSVQTVVTDLRDLSSQPDFAAPARFSSLPTAVAPRQPTVARASWPAAAASSLSSPPPSSLASLTSAAAPSAEAASRGSAASALFKSLQHQAAAGTLPKHLSSDIGAAQGVAKELEGKLAGLHGAKAKAMRQQLRELQQTLH